MSEFPQESYGLTYSDVGKMRQVRDLLLDIHGRYNICEALSTETFKLNELFNDAILSSCHLRIKVEDILEAAGKEETPEEAIIRVRAAKYDRENDHDDHQE
jgi:hypothetical protein